MHKLLKNVDVRWFILSLVNFVAYTFLIFNDQNNVTNRVFFFLNIWCVCFWSYVVFIRKNKNVK